MSSPQEVVDLNDPEFSSCIIRTGDEERGSTSTFFITRVSETEFDIFEEHYHHHTGTDRGALVIYRSARKLGSGVDDDNKVVHQDRLVLGERFTLQCRDGAGVEADDGRIFSRLATNPITAIDLSGEFDLEQFEGSEDVTVF